MTDIYVTGIQFRGRGHARRRPEPTLPDTTVDYSACEAGGKKAAATRRAKRLAAQAAARPPIPIEPWAPLLWEEFLG